jgi:hypothetical protein
MRRWVSSIQMPLRRVYREGPPAPPVAAGTWLTTPGVLPYSFPYPFPTEREKTRERDVYGAGFCPQAEKKL